MIKKRRYMKVGDLEAEIVSDFGFSFTERIGLVFGAFKSSLKTVIDFNKDYVGQRSVSLAIAYPYEDPKTTMQKGCKHWAEYLQANPTKITKLRMPGYSQELIDSLAKQPQIEEIEIYYGKNNFRDLTALGKLPNLRKLVIENFPVEASLEGLAHSKSLKILHVFSRKSINFQPLAKMTMLDELEIGTGVDPAFMGTVKTENFKFLKPLKNLKRIHIYAVIPEDKDLTVLAHLTNLEKGWYYIFRGQTPSIKELAELNPVFNDVYQTYVKHKQIDTKNVYYYSKWKFFGRR